LLRASDPFADWVERRLPARWKAYLETYANWVGRFLHSSASGETTKAIRLNLALVLLQLALVAVIFISAGMLARLDFARLSPFVEANKKALLWGAACLLTVPNAIFLFFRARALGGAVGAALIPAKVAETSWALSFLRFTRLLFTLAAIALLFLESAMLSGTIMPEEPWARVLMAVTLFLIAAFGWRRFRRMGAESLETLRGVLTKETETDPTESAADLLDIHTERMRVSRTAGVCGCSLKQINLRARGGASVIGIERGGRTIVNPTADDTVEPDDAVLLLGDDEQISRARTLLSCERQAT